MHCPVDSSHIYSNPSVSSGFSEVLIFLRSCPCFGSDEYCDVFTFVYIVKTPPQPQLNLTLIQVWVLPENELAHHPPPTTTTTENSMPAISQLLVAQFWPNLKGRFLGPYWTDFNCHDDICPGNICPGDICPYQEHLSRYWPDFDQTLKVQGVH